MEEKLTCMPILALRGLVIFPNSLMHFDVAREKSMESIRIAMEGSRRVFLVAQQDIREEDPKAEELCAVGITAKIHQVLKMPNDLMRVFIKAENRAMATNVVVGQKYLYGDIVECSDKPYRITAEREHALVRSLTDAFGEYLGQLSNPAEGVFMNAVTIKDLSEFCDYIAANSPLPVEDKQDLLEEFHPVKRAERLLVILKKEAELLAVETEINAKVQEQIDENQRDYFLREKLRAISEELGEGDTTIEEADEYHLKIEKLICSEEIKEKLHKEVDKLLKMPAGAHESLVVRNYIDLCIELPYDKVSKDNTDIKKAEKILNADHYGLEKVKERILEFLAAKMFNPDLKGQIICLAGPPGTGKTSVAKSVARALNKKYTRISLGGVHDESEIRGHRKTYVGAMPGRIVDALKTAGVSNPVMLLDEVDKLSNDYKGDPSSALLEVLDSEQNYNFRDNYVELPVDLSRVFFIATANNVDNIPAPLLDRMEIIELVSYTSEEKFSIAKKHLIRKQMKRHGLTSKNFSITDSALREIINSYVREAGVRQLERKITSLCRKAAKILCEGEKSKVTIKESALEDMLGAPKYKDRGNDKKDEIGVTNGLAWTSVGGEMLKIEVSVLKGSGKINITGSLGNVMKESANLAVSYVRSKAAELGIDEDFYKNKDIHIHAPEGAVPKDGPSAGVTITTSLVSALLGLPVNSTVAMTGEITLKGKVLPIGGLREKTMAAYNNGIKSVIIPSRNVPDLKEVEQVVRDNINFIPVDSVDTVLKSAISFDILPDSVDKIVILNGKSKNAVASDCTM